MRIDIWSDIVCPFCYLGKERLTRALAAWEHGDEVAIVWHSFELDPSAPRERAESMAEHLAAKYGMSVQQAEESQRSLAEQFAVAGLTFAWERARTGNTFDAHRVVHLAAEQGRAAEVVERLMRGYFSEGAAIGDAAVVTALATEAGLDAAEVERVLASDAYADAVRADEAQATQLGARGVPFFVLDGRLGLSGAQPVEVFSQALEEAWSTREVVLKPVAGDPDAAACEPGGACALPPTGGR
ncbi:MAG: DsbA family oxidoreductase [Propioniciclava sp.]